MPFGTLTYIEKCCNRGGGCVECEAFPESLLQRDDFFTMKEGVTSAKY